MKPLPQTDIEKLKPLIAAMLEEGNMGDRSSVEHCTVKLLEGYGYRNMDAYVDDLDNPTRVVVFGRMNGIVTKEKQVALLWVFATKDRRGEETFLMLKEMVESYVKIHTCDAIIASEWVYRGASTGMQVFLRRMGFEIQERVYCKLTK